MWESALINSVLTGAQLLGQCFQEERRMKRRTISGGHLAENIAIVGQNLVNFARA